MHISTRRDVPREHDADPFGHVNPGGAADSAPFKALGQRLSWCRSYAWCIIEVNYFIHLLLFDNEFGKLSIIETCLQQLVFHFIRAICNLRFYLSTTWAHQTSTYQPNFRAKTRILMLNSLNSHTTQWRWWFFLNFLSFSLSCSFTKSRHTHVITLVILPTFLSFSLSCRFTKSRHTCNCSVEMLFKDLLTNFFSTTWTELCWTHSTFLILFVPHTSISNCETNTTDAAAGNLTLSCKCCHNFMTYLSFSKYPYINSK